MIGIIRERDKERERAEEGLQRLLIVHADITQAVVGKNTATGSQPPQPEVETN